MCPGVWSTALACFETWIMRDQIWFDKKDWNDFGKLRGRLSDGAVWPQAEREVVRSEWLHSKQWVLLYGVVGKKSHENKEGQILFH